MSTLPRQCCIALLFLVGVTRSLAQGAFSFLFFFIFLSLDIDKNSISSSCVECLYFCTCEKRSLWFLLLFVSNENICWKNRENKRYFLCWKQNCHWHALLQHTPKRKTVFGCGYFFLIHSSTLVFLNWLNGSNIEEFQWITSNVSKRINERKERGDEQKSIDWKTREHVIFVIRSIRNQPLNCGTKASATMNVVYIDQMRNAETRKTHKATHETIWKNNRKKINDNKIIMRKSSWRKFTSMNVHWFWRTFQKVKCTKLNLIRWNNSRVEILMNERK